MPPGFMNATTALPKSGGAVAASWESAITSPSADSPAGVCARVMSVVIEPDDAMRDRAESVSYF